MFGCYKKIVILYCLQRIADERTIYSVFHLLNGKKSSQTIQDAFLFQLTALFRVYPDMNRQQFDQHIAEMVKEMWLIECGPSQYRLSEQGVKILKEQLNNRPLPQNIDGWKYHQLSAVFWERLSLLVQVVSNLIYENTKYLPIQRNQEAHLWLKQFLRNVNMDRQILAKSLYAEIEGCMNSNPHIQPELFISRLTGAHAIGMTREQAAAYYKMDLDYYKLQFQGILHFMLTVIKEKPAKFTMLNKVIQNAETEFAMTISAQKTDVLIEKGMSIEEIAAFRNLKKNTIEDHIVEMALNKPDFDINRFVSEQMAADIMEGVKKVSSKQLKHIKSIVPHAQYFEIRLVLAVFGET